MAHDCAVVVLQISAVQHHRSRLCSQKRVLRIREMGGVRRVDVGVQKLFSPCGMWSYVLANRRPLYQRRTEAVASKGRWNTRRADVHYLMYVRGCLTFLFRLFLCLRVFLFLCFSASLSVFFPFSLRARRRRNKSWRLVIKRGYKRYIEALAIIDR